MGIAKGNVLGQLPALGEYLPTSALELALFGHGLFSLGSGWQHHQWLHNPPTMSNHDFSTFGRAFARMRKTLNACLRRQIRGSPPLIACLCTHKHSMFTICTLFVPHWFMVCSPSGGVSGGIRACLPLYGGVLSLWG